MSRVPKLAPEQLDDAQRALYDLIVSGPRAQGPQAFDLVDADGVLTGPFNAMLLSPAIGTALQALGASIRYGSHLSGRCREIAILILAHHWHSAFEIAAHEAVATSIGIDAETLDVLRTGRLTELPDPQERLVATTAELLAVQGDLDDHAFAAVVAGIGRAGVLELTTLVGYYATLALQLRVFRVH